MEFSPLGLFNTFVPKDKSSHQIAHRIAYGPLPRQKLDIYGPVGQRGPLPVVLFIYGGSWSDGDRHNYGFAGAAIAAMGFVVVVADYRLLPQVEYPGFLNDCTAAFAFVAAHIGEYGGDPQSIALMGHSAGAYNCAMLALDERYLAGTAAFASLRAVVGLSGPYDFVPLDGPISLRVFGGVPDLASTQPINHVSAHAPPMWLGTGMRDRLVYPRNTTALAQKLRDAGVAVTERYFDKLDHAGTLLALTRPLRWTAPVYPEIAVFLHDRLGGRSGASSASALAGAVGAR